MKKEKIKLGTKISLESRWDGKKITGTVAGMKKCFIIKTEAGMLIYIPWNILTVGWKIR